MNVKGTTKICLKNERTGEIETIQENNMMTNAVTDLFGINIEGMLFTLNGSTQDFKTYMLPLCPKSLGGILLFSDPLEEEATPYYAPSSNPCIGYASNDVNPTANVLRGSLNLTESTKLDNGYQFVWDFTTSQGNGTIAAVALTHMQGGVGYMGDAYDNVQKILTMKQTSTTMADAGIRTLYEYAMEVNFEDNYFICMGINDSGEIIIDKVRKCFTRIGLNFELTESGDQILQETKLTPTLFKGSSDYLFHDGKDGYWYGFMNSSNSTGNCSMKWVKIKKSDFSFNEGVWSLDSVLGYRSGSCTSFNNGSSPYVYRYSTMRNGYLYLMHYNRIGLYKINVNNFADVNWIPFGFTSNFTKGDDSYGVGSICMWTIGNWVCGSDFILNSTDEVTKVANSNPFSYSSTPVFQYGPYLLTFGGYAHSGYYHARKNLFLLTPYLATINNLSTAVIKTADKTMKITYMVTEE